METFEIAFRTEFDEDSAGKFIKELQAINKEASAPKKTNILIRINSPGGYVSSLFDMVDMVSFMKKKGFKFTTYNEKMAASCASVLFSLGDKRITHPSAKLLIHKVSFGVQGDLDTIEKVVEEGRRVNSQLFDVLAKNLRFSKKRMLRECEGRDWILSSKEAEKLKFTSVGIL